MSIAALVLLAAPLSASPADQLEQAFSRLYNFDFSGSHAILDRYIAAHGSGPIGYSTRATTHLFYELDRLGILSSEFFGDDRRISEKKKLHSDPEVRSRLFRAVEEAQSRAQATLAAPPNDQNSLFAMCMTQAVVINHAALIDKKQTSSLVYAKRSNIYAQNLLQLNPQFYYARMAIGFTEYLVGSLAFFVRWFVKFEGVRGSKEEGMHNLELVAYPPEERAHQSYTLLAELAREYPENPLVRRELAKLKAER